MTLPKRADEFDFRLPDGAYGNSSGWHPVHGFSLNRQPELAPRRPLRLVPEGRAVFCPFLDGRLQSPLTPTEDEAPPFLLKVPLDTAPEDAHHGISSGGGSGLVPWGGRVLKLKRCGHSDRGYVAEPFKSYTRLERDGHHLERSELNMGGVMTFAAAVTECVWTHELNRAGLCTAYRPVGVLVLRGLSDCPFDETQLAAVVSEVTSDLRVDELVHMALSPVLAALLDDGSITVSPPNGFYDAAGLSIEATLRRFSELRDQLETIGRCVGSHFGRIHRRGYLRGFGSAWFGNDVVMPDGELTMVDFDGGTSHASEYAPDVADELRTLEIEQYLAESLLYLDDMRPTALSCFASRFIHAVRAGLEAPYQPLPPAMVQSIIDAHLPCLDALDRGLGFAGVWSSRTQRDLPGVGR